MPIFSFSSFNISLAVAIVALTTSINAPAALPESVKLALNKASLSANDISMIITPVGVKGDSRLPPTVRVIDSSRINMQTVIANDNKTNNIDTATITVDKQAIEQRERLLHAYTDDPYTYQSLEGTLAILPMSNRSATKILTNSKGNNSSSSASATSQTNTNPLHPQPIISHNPDTARTPASTMKLIPSFVALDTLGADFIWHTRVYHSGIIIGERLYGDLVIQGSGDPKMSYKRLQQLLSQVQKAGIRHIDGDIIIDSTIFNNVSKDPAAFDHSPLRPYNASPDGFLVNFNTIGIKSKPASNGQAQLSYAPQLANYELPSFINTRGAACARANYSLAPQWQANKLNFNAPLPERCGEHIFYIGYPDAKDFATRVVAADWQALGNTLSGKVSAQETPYRSYQSSVTNHKRPARGLAALPLSPLPIVSYSSLTLSQQIYDINHFSNNVMTEQVALSIGAYSKAPSIAANVAPSVASNAITPTAVSLYQFGSPKSTDYPQALQTINQWWQTNLTTAPPYLTNGSGLCRECTLSAANLEELLTYAYAHPDFDTYVDSLGIAGVSGTIMYHSRRMPDSGAIGRAWIKTGTLNNVTAMAGYVKGQSGQDYTVVGLINTKRTLNPYTSRPVLDAMLDWSAKQ